MEDMADLAVAFMRELPPGEFPYLIEHIHQHLAVRPADDGASSSSAST